MSRGGQPMRDSHWDVVVVGAGLGGLAAAAGLTRQGLRVLVLEQHDVPGGYAHRFLRRPRGSGVTYSFDVALHQIGGLAAERRLHQQLASVGVLPRIRLRRFDDVYRTCGPAHDLVASGDVTRYQQQLRALFPDHGDGIAELLRRLSAADMGVRGPDDPPPAALHLIGHSLREVVRQHVPDDRFVAIFSSLWAYLGLPPSELCAFTFAQVWASYHLGGSYYVEGGGQALSDAFVAVIADGGGQVLLNAAVTRIVTTRGRVAGVQTRRHGPAFAPVVISNASVRDTFERLLEGTAPELRERRVAERAPMSVSIVETYVGMRGRAEELGLPDRLLVSMPSYDLEEQWSALGRGDLAGVPTVLANHNLSDPAHVPPGRSILNAAVLAAGAPWMGMDDATYAERKRAAEVHLLDLLASRIPELRDRIEVCETGTPRTMHRYSWNPDGAIYGFPASSRTHPLRRPRPRTALPGLYLAGAWTFPAGGFHGAMVSGLHTAGLVTDDLAGRPSSGRASGPLAPASR